MQGFQTKEPAIFRRLRNNIKIILIILFCCLYELNGITDSLYTLYLIGVDGKLEFLLYPHDDLEHIKRISSQIIIKGCLHSHFVFVDA